MLLFVQTYPRWANLKEGKNTLRISLEGGQTIEQAVELLGEMAGVAV